MHKLPEVQEAKELMKEAMEWSSFKWLWEKGTVRGKADRANAALDRVERAIKAKWSDEHKATYKNLAGKKVRSAERENGQLDEQGVLVKKVLDADRAAKRAQLDAENTFAEAERELSTGLARDGCKKAIRSWELHEKAIRSAEAVRDTGSAPK